MKGIFDDIFEEMREDAREEGRAEGREEGREEGRKEGRLEAQVSVVRHIMTKQTWSLERTLKFLHLTKEEGESLMPLL